MIVMLGAFFFYRSRDFSSWSYVQRSFWQAIPLFEHMHWTPLGPQGMWALGLIWKASLLLAGIGLFTRFSCAAAFGLSLYLLGMQNNFGKLEHNDPIIIWCFLILAVGRSGDAWSLDQLIAAIRGNRPPGPHAEYRWPLRMMQLLMAMIFCIAGFSKLRTSGVAWALSDNLRNVFLMEHYLANPALSWGVWIAAHPMLCRLLAVASLTAEVTAPLALLSRWARWIIIPSLFAVQLGNQLLLGIDFRQFMLCYACWIPWTNLGRRISAASNGSKIAVLFDGSCGLCKRTVDVIRRLDLLDRVEILDATNDWPTVARRFPSLSQQQCMKLMHVVDAHGTITTGFYGYRTIAWNIPLWWPLLPLLYLPGVPTAGNLVYERIADGRFRATCRIEDAPTAQK